MFHVSGLRNSGWTDGLCEPDLSLSDETYLNNYKLVSLKEKYSALDKALESRRVVVVVVATCVCACAVSSDTVPDSEENGGRTEAAARGRDAAYLY